MHRVFAVIKTGGKQYKVQVGETIEVEKLEAEKGAQIRLDQVLLAANDGDVAYGRPLIEGAVVTARVVRQHKGPKLIVFRYKSKSRYRRRTGHRQKLTQLAIQAIEVPGWPAVTIETVRAAAPAAETAAPALAAETATPTTPAAPVEPAAASAVEAAPTAAPAAETAPGATTPVEGVPVSTAPASEEASATETAPPDMGSAAPPADALPATNPQAQVEASDRGRLGAMPSMAVEEPPHAAGPVGEAQPESPDQGRA